MSIYAIGDVQGCFEPLQRLLKKINFNPEQDELWFAGDLVNRGPQSLAVLRFIKALPHKKVVLGNHDLHLLAVYYAGFAPKGKDTLDELLAAPDLAELMEWLRQQPLLIADLAHNIFMSHAGIPPQWDVAQAQALAQEAEAVLQGNDHLEFFKVMYGNQPDCWQADLTGFDRTRAIINYFTRMRFVDARGALDLLSKEGVGTAPAGYVPWFRVANRKTQENKLLFGHWAALEGNTNTANTFALDTGCVWGGQLSALRLDDFCWFRVNA